MMPSLHRRFVIALVLLAGLTAASCGASAPESVAFSEGANDATAPKVVPEHELRELELVAFHARWVCERQRRTFPELDGVEQALTETLIGADLGRPTYDAFLSKLAESQALREKVLKQYEETCRA